MSSTRLRALALAPYPASAPSTRYRVAQFMPHLRARGIEVTLHAFLDEEAYRATRAGPAAAVAAAVRAARRLRARLADIGSFDVVLVQRGVAPLLDGAAVRRLRRAGVPLVYDFDDAVFLRQEGGRGWLEWARRPAATTRALCRAAEVVLAGNEYLASWAREAVGAGAAARVRVLPSVVDTDRVRPRAHRSGGAAPTLGWVGSDTTIPYLESLAPALRALSDRLAYRLLVVAGSRSPRLDGVPFDFQPWGADEESGLLASLDVGLYPLDDTPWSRGKCGFKALQYLASGAPCVAAPVGVLPDIVRDGRTGRLARTTDEWVEACAELLGDREARERMGAEGRRLVEEAYSVRAVLPHLVAALESAAGGGHG